MCGISRCWLDSMIIAQVCLRLATIKGHSKMCSFNVLGGPKTSQYLVWPPFASRSATHLLRIELIRFVDCDLWNVGPLLFNGCAKLLGIKSNHFYCHITTAHVPWWVKFLRACFVCLMFDTFKKRVFFEQVKWKVQLIYLTACIYWQNCIPVK